MLIIYLADLPIWEIRPVVKIAWVRILVAVFGWGLYKVLVTIVMIVWGMRRSWACCTARLLLMLLIRGWIAPQPLLLLIMLLLLLLVLLLLVGMEAVLLLWMTFVRMLRIRVLFIWILSYFKDQIKGFKYSDISLYNKKIIYLFTWVWRSIGILLTRVRFSDLLLSIFGL